MAESTSPQKAALGWLRRTNRDDCRQHGDRSEEEQRVRHVELVGVVVRGLVYSVPFSAACGGWMIVAARTMSGATTMKMAKPTRSVCS